MILGHGLPLEPLCFSHLKSLALALIDLPHHAPQKLRGYWCEPEPLEASCD